MRRYGRGEGVRERVTTTLYVETGKKGKKKRKEKIKVEMIKKITDRQTEDRLKIHTYGTDVRDIRDMREI